MERHEYKNSRTNAVLLFVGSVAMAIGFLVLAKMLAKDENTFKETFGFILVGGFIFMAIVSIFAANMGLGLLSDKSVRLIIDEEGIIDKRHSDEQIPWCDVRGLKFDQFVVNGCVSCAWIIVDHLYGRTTRVDLTDLDDLPEKIVAVVNGMLAKRANPDATTTE
ncbi:MAG: hypothetical protein K8T89_10005 [Planctomycetes bacterium]|nr:hypothetical protein [Planctomycetota bacterium]